MPPRPPSEATLAGTHPPHLSPLPRTSPHSLAPCGSQVFCRKLLSHHEEWRIPSQGVLFLGGNSRGGLPVEEAWRQLCRIAARLPASPVTGQRLRVAVAYSALSRNADTERFRDSERVLAAFKALEYDIIVLCARPCPPLHRPRTLIDANPLAPPSPLGHQV